MKLFFCLLFFFSCRLFPQNSTDSAELHRVKTNLDIFYILADSSAEKLSDFIPPDHRRVNLQLNLGNEYSILGSRIISSLQKNSYTVISGNIRDSADESIHISYVIDNAEVEYGGIFRDGFLGDYYIPRNISLSGNFTISTSSVKYVPFSFFSADTIVADDIKNLENVSFIFTHGDVPAEPFFSGLLEPVVAIGTAAVAVFLFFTIRSR